MNFHEHQALYFPPTILGVKQENLSRMLWALKRNPYVSNIEENEQCIRFMAGSHQGEITTGTGILALCVWFSKPCLPERRKDLLMLLHRIHFVLPTGCFKLNEHSGFLYFCIDYSPIHRLFIPMEHARHLVSSMQETLENLSGILESTMYGSEEEAFKAQLQFAHIQRRLLNP